MTETKIVPARPDEAIHKVTEELTFIVKTSDMRALGEWIKRYIRRLGVSYPIVPNEGPGISNGRQAAQTNVCAHLGMGVARAAIWSEKTDIEKARTHVHAELYFLDVLGKMTHASPEETN